MALQSDSQGFLVGDPVDLSRVIDQFRQIRQDVADIKRSMLGAVANVNRNSRSSSEGSNARNQDSSTSGQSSAGNSGAATPNRPRSSNTSSDGLPPVNPNGTVTPNGRGQDTSGRFSGNGESSSGSATRNNDDRKSQGIISGFTGRIATAVKASAAGAEEADPTIKAFQEVAEPMRRGYEIFAGGGDKKDRWYKKIFKELNLFRKDETAFNRAANRSLHNIEGNPGGGGGESGSMGMFSAFLLLLGNLLLKIPILGTAIAGVTAVLSKIPLLKNLLPGGSSTNIPPVPPTGIPPASGGIGSRLLRGGSGLLKRIPLLGALIGGVSAASDIYGTETDDSLTRGEKDKRNGKAAGGLAGSVGGMMAGAAAGSLLGPVGTVVGGAVGMFLGDQAGQIIGEKMGEWTTQLRDADVPGKIIGAWNATTEAIKSGWESVKKGWGEFVEKAKTGWDSFTGLFASAYEGLKSLPFIGPAIKAAEEAAKQAAEIAKAAAEKAKEGVVAAKDRVAQGATQAADKVKQGAQWAGENTTVGKGAKAAWNGAKSVTNDLLDTERKPRSKKGNAETAMKVLMDKGWSKEQAAGIAANLAAESGFDTNAVGDSGKAKGIAQWHPDRQKKFEEVNGKKLSDATFEEQVGFVDWELNNTEKKAGDKIRTATTAEQAAAFTEQKYERSALGLKGGVQPERIGAASKYANLDIVEEAPETSPVMPSLTDDPTQGGRYKYEKLEGGKIQVTDNQTGVMELASDEQANAFRKQEGKPYLDKVAAINANDMPAYYNLAAGPVNTQVQTASAAAPKVPTFAPHPAIGEAPPVIQPLASDSNRNLTVTMPTPDVGQDVRDRNIAHIVTGGFSGRG